MASPFQVRKTAYFSLRVPNLPGQGARMLSGFAAHGVNLIAFTGFPSGRAAQVDFMPHNPKKFLEVAEKLGYKPNKQKIVFLATGDSYRSAHAFQGARDVQQRARPGAARQ